MRGEFETARSAVAQAIEVEPRGSRDYLRRLTQYQTTRVRIDLMQERARWQRAHQQFRGELAEFKGQQLQLLGLLAAIVAFIVTAGNIASQTGGVERGPRRASRQPRLGHRRRHRPVRRCGAASRA